MQGVGQCSTVLISSSNQNLQTLFVFWRKFNMTIKEVSEKYDISQDTLRYYERIGEMLREVRQV